MPSGVGIHTWTICQFVSNIVLTSSMGIMQVRRSRIPSATSSLQGGSQLQAAPTDLPVAQTYSEREGTEALTYV